MAFGGGSSARGGDLSRLTAHDLVASSCTERNAKTVLKEALRLPEADRADIAGALLKSLEPEEEADVDAAWRREIRTRVAALDAGEVETIPWEGVRNRLLARLSERRAG